jgi:hypothetical protein
MAKEPRAVRVYVILVAAAAAGLWAAALAGALPAPADPLSRPAPLAAAFAVAIVAAGRFPLEVSFRSKVYVDTAIVTAAAMLFDVPWAMAAAAAGVAANEAILGATWTQGVFNTAQTAFYVGAGSSVFHAVSALPISPALPGLGNPVAPVACAAVMYAVNSFAVATVAALQEGERPLRSWLDGLTIDLPEHAALVACAAVGVLVARDRPWALPFLAVPVAVVYLSLRRSRQVEATAYAALELLARVVDLRDPARAGHGERAANLAHAAARALGLPPADAERIATAARLHDVGRADIGRDDPSAHRPDAAGPDAIAARQAAAAAGIVVRFPRFALVARDIRHQWERWDGGGVPDGLTGEAIPLGARIVAAVAAFDDLAATAPDPPTGRERALRELRAGAGHRWDPRVVEALATFVAGDLEAENPPVRGQRATPDDQPAYGGGG